MKKLFEKYKMVFVAVFGVPILAFIGIIAVMLFQRSLDGSMVVTMIAALFTYYGTVILAAVTLLQNEKITELSLRNSQIEEIRLKNQYHPIIELDGIYNTDGKKYKTRSLINNYGIDSVQVDDTGEKTVWIYIKNTGNASAYNLTYKDFQLQAIIDDRKQVAIKDLYKEHLHAELRPKETLCLECSITSAFFEDKYDLNYQNEFGHHFNSPIFLASGEFDNALWVQCGIGPQKWTVEAES